MKNKNLVLLLFLFFSTNVFASEYKVSFNNPVGVIVAYVASQCPSGYLKADGTPVSRTTYSALFDVMGISHGAGDGSTTFHLPDYRGRFLRGVDESAGRDSDKATRSAMNAGGNSGNLVGSVQGHAFQTHTHIQNPHNHSKYHRAQGSYGVVSNTLAVNNASSTAQDNSFSTENTTATNQNAGATGANSQASSTETRPVNAYVQYCVKY